MKSWPAALKAHHTDRRVRTLTDLLQVTRASDGSVFGFTPFNRALDYDHSDGNGVVTYRHSPGLELSALKETVGFAPDTMDATWLIEDQIVTRDDFLAGAWKGATYKLMLADYTDRSGPSTLNAGIAGERSAGEIGDFDISGKRATVKLRSLREAYFTRDLRVTKPQCGLRFATAEADGTLRCGVRRDLADVPLWPATTAVTAGDPRDASLGSIVRASVFDDRFYICIAGGTTDASEPSFNTTIGAITTEAGGVRWETRRALTIPATVATIVEANRIFTVTVATDAPDGTFALGKAVWLTGNNADLFPVDIKAWTLASKTVELYRPTPRLLQVGDTLTLGAGCARTRAACKGFNNIRRGFGFWDAPLNNELFKVTEI